MSTRFAAAVITAVVVSLAAGTYASAAPAPSWPEKGKPIAFIVPYPAGGTTDVYSRFLIPYLERDLGTSVQVVNRPGASTQVGLTALAKARPDGYTIGCMPIPTGIITYIDPNRKAPYSRKDFEPLANQVFSPTAVAVRGDSPYKTIKDLIDAAKAKPETIKAGTTGLLTTRHLSLLEMERVTGAKFATVHFDGGAPSNTALLGGHVDMKVDDIASYLAFLKDGTMRVLGVMDEERNNFFPDIPTMKEQGLNLVSIHSSGIATTGGTPKEIVARLAQVLRTAITSEQHRKEMERAGQTIKYMDAAQYAKYWEEQEAITRVLFEAAKK